MNDPEIEKIQNLPIEQRADALIEWIEKRDKMGLVTCITDFPFGPIPSWIKCSDNLPDKTGYFLTAYKEIDDWYFRVSVYFVDKKTFQGNPIYWMMIPEPPKDFVT